MAEPNLAAGWETTKRAWHRLTVEMCGWQTSPGRRSEQRGIRPALIIQNDVGNEYAATTIVTAITSTIKIYPITVPLKKGEGGLPQPSMVNLPQILTLDKSRLQRRIGALRSEIMEKVDAATRISLAVG